MTHSSERSVQLPTSTTRAVAAWFYRVLERICRRLSDGTFRLAGWSGCTTARFADPSEDDKRSLRMLPGVATSLRPEYAAVLSAVDLDERPPHEVASEMGLTPHTNVRRHRPGGLAPVA